MPLSTKALVVLVYLLIVVVSWAEATATAHAAAGGAGRRNMIRGPRGARKRQSLRRNQEQEVTGNNGAAVISIMIRPKRTPAAPSRPLEQNIVVGSSDSYDYYSESYDYYDSYDDYGRAFESLPPPCPEGQSMMLVPGEWGYWFCYTRPADAQPGGVGLNTLENGQPSGTGALPANVASGDSYYYSKYSKSYKADDYYSKSYKEGDYYSKSYKEDDYYYRSYKEDDYYYRDPRSAVTFACPLYHYAKVNNAGDWFECAQLEVTTRSGEGAAEVPTPDEMNP